MARTDSLRDPGRAGTKARSPSPRETAKAGKKVGKKVGEKAGKKAKMALTSASAPQNDELMKS